MMSLVFACLAILISVLVAFKHAPFHMLRKSSRICRALRMSSFEQQDGRVLKLKDMLQRDIIGKNFDDLVHAPHVLYSLRDFGHEIDSWQIRVGKPETIEEWNRLTASTDTKHNEVFSSNTIMEAYFNWRIGKMVNYENLSIDPFSSAKGEILRESIALTEGIFGKITHLLDLENFESIPILLLYNALACRSDNHYNSTLKNTVTDMKHDVPTDHQIALPMELKKKARLDVLEKLSTLYVKRNDGLNVWNALNTAIVPTKGNNEKILSIIPDKLGKGLILDLLLTHVLLLNDVVDKVVFHAGRCPSLQQHPTIYDIARTIDTLAKRDTSDVWNVHHIGDRLMGYLVEERIVLVEDKDWDLSVPILWSVCNNNSTAAMILPNATEWINQSILTIVKGSKNLQKLLIPPSDDNDDNIARRPWQTHLRTSYQQLSHPICSIRSLVGNHDDASDEDDALDKNNQVVIELKA